MKLLSLKKTQSSTQLVARRQMKKHLKRIRNKEYNRLRDMVPNIANKQKISKVTVIEEAVRYIDELHRALASRLEKQELPEQAQQQRDNLDVKDFVHSFIPADLFQRKAPPCVQLEKQQKIPTYLKHDTARPKRPAKFV